VIALRLSIRTKQEARVQLHAVSPKKKGALIGNHLAATRVAQLIDRRCDKPTVLHSYEENRFQEVRINLNNLFVVRTLYPFRPACVSIIHRGRTGQVRTRNTNLVL